MADNDKVESNTSNSNEWEVVSLTASVYAASPSPKEVERKGDDKVNTYAEDEASRALFISGHFVFPPSRHENLPIEPDNTEIGVEHLKNVDFELDVGEGHKSGRKDEENWNLKRLNAYEELSGTQFFEEKGHQQSISGKQYEESSVMDMEDLNLSDKERSIYSAATFSSLHSELGGSITYDGNLDAPEFNEPSEHGLKFPTSDSRNHAKDGEYQGSALPRDTWWKRRAASLYAHAKETNACWSIFVAVAVMGLVILGRRWQQERWQVLRLKWLPSINNEKSGRILGPIS